MPERPSPFGLDKQCRRRIRPEPLIALDFGLRRIGVATSTGGVITARGCLPARAGLPQWSELDRLVHEYRPQVLVLGCPPDPEEQFRIAFRNFREQAERRYSLGVEAVAEHLSTREARSMLREARSSGRLGRRVRKGEADSLAACLIAEDWLCSPMIHNPTQDQGA